MLTTSVKDNGFMNLVPGGNTKNNAVSGNNSFQGVWDRQTSSSAKKAADGQTSKTASQKQSLQQRELGSKRANNLKENADSTADEKDIRKKENADKENFDKENVDEEKALEAAREILLQLSQILDREPAEVQAMLQESGLEPVDLLSAEKLGDFVLEAAGAEGSLELLTDEELYGKFRQIMESRETILQGMDGLSETDLKDAAEDTGKMEMLPAEHIPAEKEGQRPLSKELQAAEEDLAAEESAPVSEPAGSVKESSAGESGSGSGETEDQNLSSGKQTATKGPEEKKDEGVQNTGNLVLQQILEDNASLAETVSAESREETEGTEPQDVMRQVMDQMRAQIKADTNGLELQLHPASLGNIQVQLASKGGMVTAQFIAQNESVKAVLETQMIQLRESLEEQGIRIEAIEVSVQTNAFDENLENQSGKQNQQAPQSRGGRRLRIDGEVTQEMLDALTSDEKMAVEVMAANGSTVDYTA